MRSAFRSLLGVALVLWGCSGTKESQADSTSLDVVDSTGQADNAVQADATVPGDLAADVRLQDTLASDAQGDPDLPLMDDFIDRTCCQADTECPEGMVCVIREDETQGVCYWEPVGTGCYHQEDCDVYRVCVGALLPTCGDDEMPLRGTCVPVDAGCCTVDGDCPEGTHCVGESVGGGTCMVDLPDAYCWDDADCGLGLRCMGESWCPCNADCAATNVYGACQPTPFVECVETYSGCPCEEGCMDGFGVTVWYPASAGTFDEAISPPQELLDVAVAAYSCSICTCEESWSLVQNGELVPLEETGVEGFCTELLKLQSECDDCLVTWFGGCC